MPDRDRDAQGRPQNARPRDRLGRPLPYGSEGAGALPEGLTLSPVEALDLAQVLLDDGRPFHAHEALETAWKSAPDDERALWQGLAQLTVGLTHYLRGNLTGARAVVERAISALDQYATQPPYDLDIGGLVTWGRSLLAGLDDPSPVVAPLHLRLSPLAGTHPAQNDVD